MYLLFVTMYVFIRNDHTNLTFLLGLIVENCVRHTIIIYPEYQYKKLAQCIGSVYNVNMASLNLPSESVFVYFYKATFPPLTENCCYFWARAFKAHLFYRYCGKMHTVRFE